MQRCPNCGQAIQSFMHGTCYTCGRNAEQNKRFGRGGQSVRRPEREEQPPAEQPPPTERPRPKRKQRKERSSGAEAKIARPASPKRREDKTSSVAGQPEDDVKKKAVARTPRQRILLGLNRFIGDVFNEGQSFGAILCGAGLADAAVRHLGKDTKARNRFNRALVCELKDWLPAAVGKPSYHVLARLYGLDGKAPDAPAALAQSMRRDEKDVRNLVDAALFTLQFEDRRRELTALVVRAALAALA